MLQSLAAEQPWALRHDRRWSLILQSPSVACGTAAWPLLAKVTLVAEEPSNVEAFSSYSAHADVYIFSSPCTVDPVFSSIQQAKTFALSSNCNHVADFDVGPQLLQFVQPDHLLTGKAVTGTFNLHQLEEKFPDSSTSY
ncbi:hypothetical protein STEG23_016542 [Scotinomys teguina]